MAEIVRLNNRQIESGETLTPTIAIPEGASRCTLRVSRAQWPAAGVTLDAQFSFDGGVSFPMVMPTFIGPGTTSAKDPVLPDAVIGFGWGARTPTHARAMVVTPLRFRANVVIEAD